MRKILVAWLLLLAIGLSGCGGSGDTGSANTESGNMDSGAAGMDAANAAENENTPLLSQDFSDAGTNPNNLMGGDGKMVFDQEHLYFDQYRLDLDGTNLTQLPINVENGNIYDRNLYVSHNNNSHYYIAQTNLSTMESERIVEYNGDRNEYPVIGSMLVVDGLLFYTVKDTVINSYSIITGINLNTMEPLGLLYHSYINSDPILSTDGEYLYAFVLNDDDKRETYRAKLDDFVKDPMTELSYAYEAMDFNSFSTIIQGSNGFLRLSRGSEMRYIFYPYDGLQEDSWKDTKVLKQTLMDSSIPINEVSDFILYFYRALGAPPEYGRYPLGDNLLTINLNEGIQLNFYPNMEPGKGETLATMNGNMNNTYHGIYQDTCYLVVAGGDADVWYFATVDRDGNFNQKVIEHS